MDQPLVLTMVSVMVSNTIPPRYQMFKYSLYPITSPLVSNSNFLCSFNVQVNYAYYSYYIYLFIYLLLSKFIRYMLIQLYTLSIFSNYIYHTIYTPYVKMIWYQYAYGIKNFEHLYTSINQVSQSGNINLKVIETLTMSS
jgi:hypothetical protein